MLTRDLFAVANLLVKFVICLLTCLFIYSATYITLPRRFKSRC